MSSERREWGWWRILKGTLALAYSGAAAFYAFNYVVDILSPDTSPPGYSIDRIQTLGDALALAFLGLPWSVAVMIGFADSRASTWVVTHRWVPMTLFFLAVVLNIALLWFWKLRRKRLTQ